MAAPIMSDYLKKYLSGDGEEKKKKKRRKISGPVAKIQKSRIVDDDVDFKSLLPENLSNTLEDDVGDNDPVIADFVDERPEHIKVLEKYRSSGAWKLMGKKDELEVYIDQFTTSRHDSDSDQSLHKRQNDSRQNSANNGNAVSEQTSRQKLNSKSEHSSNRKKDSDHFLPSRTSLDSDHTLQRKQRHDSDSDHSPPRRQRNELDSDHSPPRKQMHESDSDHSPPRKQRHNSNSDHSPLRRQRNELDSDHSPLRKQRHDSDSDHSPPRRKRANSDSDQSPPRRQKHNLNSNQPVPPSRVAQNDSDSMSTKRLRHDSIDSDQSHPRKIVKQSKDLSPKQLERDTNSDHSSSKWQHNKDIGQPGQTSHRQPGSKHRNDHEDKMLAGKKAGLSSAKDMRIEADELRRHEDEHFKQISDERLGKGSATVFRDKFGKKRDLVEEKKQESENAKQKAKEEEKFQKWGKGLKQREDQSKNVEEALQEALKPLARYKDDEDLDKMLRDMDRAEDPMLAFLKKKKNKNNSLQQKAEKPRYKGPAPLPNRFGIMPGYRWDGVDRSNGFEKQIYAKQAESKAKTEQAYKWSVEDM